MIGFSTTACSKLRGSSALTTGAYEEHILPTTSPSPGWSTLVPWTSGPPKIYCGPRKNFDISLDTILAGISRYSIVPPQSSLKVYTPSKLSQSLHPLKACLAPPQKTNTRKWWGSHYRFTSCVKTCEGEGGSMGNAFTH